MSVATHRSRTPSEIRNLNEMTKSPSRSRADDDSPPSSPSELSQSKLRTLLSENKDEDDESLPPFSTGLKPAIMLPSASEGPSAPLSLIEPSRLASHRTASELSTLHRPPLEEEPPEQPQSSWSVASSILGLTTLICFGVLCLAPALTVPGKYVASSFAPALTAIETIALAGILLLAPASHLLVGRQRDSNYRFFQPFEGGSRFVLLQALAWTAYGTGIALVVTAAWWGISGATRSLLRVAGLGGVVAQALVLVSIHYYWASLPEEDEDQSTPSAEQQQQQQQQPLPSPKLHNLPAPPHLRAMLRGLSWRSAGSVGTALALLSLLLALAIESNTLLLRRSSRLALGGCALAAVLVAVPVTHLVAGHRLHNADRPVSKRMYRWWQPFQGGSRFVILQALGWMLWTIALLAGSGMLLAAAAPRAASAPLRLLPPALAEPLLEAIESLHDPAAAPPAGWRWGGWVTGSGFVAVAAQLAVLLSLSHFDAALTHAHKQQHHHPASPSPPPRRACPSLRAVADVLLVAGLYHAPVAGAAVTFLPWAALYLQGTAAHALALVALYAVYYSSFVLSRPQVDGSMSWALWRHPRFPLWPALARYLEAEVRVCSPEQIAAAHADCVAAARELASGRHITHYAGVFACGPSSGTPA